jgi:hypothetical protein
LQFIIHQKGERVVTEENLKESLTQENAPISPDSTQRNTPQQQTSKFTPTMADKLFEALKLGKRIPDSETFLFKGIPPSYPIPFN